MRALVTGAGGFVGQWLCAELLSDGWDVHGVALTGAPAGGTLKDWQRDAVLWHDLDLRDPAEAAEAIALARPDAVFHLAAVSYVPEAGMDPGAAWSTNVLAAVHVLDTIAMRRRAGEIDPVVLIVGSGEQYGPHAPAELPLSETASLEPRTVYAATKVAQELAALASWRATGTRVIATRPFNHSGPGQAQTFLLPALVQRVLDAHAEGDDTIRIGNPDSVRDYLHVQDVARAYIYLAQRGTPGEVYNICSGAGTRVADLAQLVIDEVARSRSTRLDGGDGRSLRAVLDPALMRAVDVPALVGSPAKLTAETTWTPNHTLEMLIEDLVYFTEYGETD